MVCCFQVHETFTKSYIEISLTHSAYLLDQNNNNQKKKLNCKSKHFCVKKTYLHTKQHFVQYVVKHTINQNDPNQKSYKENISNKKKR